MLPAPAPRTNQVPRAQLLHVRGIGTVERDLMPDRARPDHDVQGRAPNRRRSPETRSPVGRHVVYPARWSRLGAGPSHRWQLDRRMG